MMLKRMSKGSKIYEGKAKILFEGTQPGTLVQHFKDDATAYNRQKEGTIDGKGVLNNFISECIMLRLTDIGIPTHFIRRLNMREQLIRKVEIIPLEVVVRNVAAGTMAKRLGIEEGKQLARPVVEFYYKDDDLNDPLVTEEHIFAFNWAHPYEINFMANMALRTNDFLSGLFAGIGLRLVDFKLEFGRLEGDEGEEPQLLLADEISPDSCRLWDFETGEKMDKDRFRRDMGKVKEAYQEVAKRLGVLPGVKNGEMADEQEPANDTEPLQEPVLPEPAPSEPASIKPKTGKPAKKPTAADTVVDPDPIEGVDKPLPTPTDEA